MKVYMPAGSIKKKIMIVGGGSAGWMSAATLIRFFPHYDITLIESPKIPTVGVGESTLGQIRGWTGMLGIQDNDFIPHTDASIKLSIRFTDFYKKNQFFHFPFGRPFIDENVSQTNDWWFKKISQPDTPLNDFADCIFPQMAFVNNNRITNRISSVPFKYHRDSAFHFDATKFGLWLRDHYAIPKGVKHIKEEITTIEQNKEGIVSLNHKHKADLYIDCTGFRSLLLGGALKEPFDSYTDMLPNNSAWATRVPYTDKKKQLVPYTNCTAIENGWVWNIPLWSRIGTGYVYSDKFVSDEDALKEFKNHLGREDLEFKNIKMRVGLHRRLFVKNVCAIGLSAGFIEPLESNGLLSVHEFLWRLCRNLDRGEISQWDKDNYNATCKAFFHSFSQFVAMHYALSHRQDTPYWKANFNRVWSKELLDLKAYLHSGFTRFVFDREWEFTHPPTSGLTCISAGFNWGPTDLVSLMHENLVSDPQLLYDSWKKPIERMNKRKELWNKAVLQYPTLYEYLKKIHGS